MITKYSDKGFVHLLKQKAHIGFIALALNSCAPKSQISRSTVSDHIKKQYGFELSQNARPGINTLPPSVDPINGISEDEAVSIALYNNAQYQADLAQIAIAQADIFDAGMVSNPLLRYLLPSGGLNVSGYINFGFDFLWQRPKRVAIARAEMERTSESMIQRGYTLIRDVLTALADFQFARDRVAVLTENVMIRSEIARLNNLRLKLGEISGLEAFTSRADSAAAVDEFIKASLDTILIANRLHTLLGFTPDTLIDFKTTRINFPEQKISVPQYLQLAYENHPGLKAAQFSVASAGSKIGWERSRIIALLGTIGFGEVNPKGSKVLPGAFQPGIQIELPVLNRNQAKIARARAELEQALYNYVAVRQRIANEVADAYHRYEQTCKSYEIYNSNVLPSLEEAVRLVQLTFKRGDISYLPVLEAIRQLVNGRLRKAEIEAEIRRSISQLNFVIGKKME